MDGEGISIFKKEDWLLLLFLLISSSAIATDISRILLGDGENEVRFNAPEPLSLMTVDESRRYSALQKELDCDEADLILNSAFVRAFPQFDAVLAPQPDEDPSQAWARGYWIWRVYTFLEFNESIFCNALQRIEMHEKSLEKVGDLPFFEHRDLLDGNTHETPQDQRDLEVQRLFSLFVERRYKPAGHYLFDRIASGDLFNDTDAIEYGITIALCLLGEDCASHCARILVLEKTLDPERLDLIRSFSSKRTAGQALIPLKLLAAENWKESFADTLTAFDYHIKYFGQPDPSTNPLKLGC